jgi:hypothetical protein
MGRLIRPSDDLAFLSRKIKRYLSTGSALVLDVDPDARAIVAQDAQARRTYSAGERFEHEAVPWLTFEVDEIFVDLDEFGL